MRPADTAFVRTSIALHAIALIVLIAACSASGGVGPGGDGGKSSVVDSIALSLDSTSLVVGDTVRLSAVPRDSAGNAVTGVSLTWSSSDTSVAVVSSDGLVTAKDLGEADIEVAASSAASGRIAAMGVSASSRGGNHRSRVHIRGVPRVVITPSSKSVDLGATVQYSASITDTYGNRLHSTPTVRWRSSVPAVATINNSSGLATAVGKGTTSISVVVSTSRSLDFEPPMPAKLTVSVCSGLLDITSWDATSISSSYTQAQHLPGTDFTIDIKVK